jgi:hypothetical protein
VAVVKQIRERLTVVFLSEKEYVSTLESASPVTAHLMRSSRDAPQKLKQRTVDVERPALP